MIAFASDEYSASDALAHYQIIRRDGLVLPFTPRTYVDAVVKAFWAEHGSKPDQGNNDSWLMETVQTLVGRLCTCRRQIRLHACDRQRAVRIQGDRTLSDTAIDSQLGAGGKQGFFKASKPDLHNAP